MVGTRTSAIELKGNEGTSRFSRMGKLEFPKFYGEDVKAWLFRVKQFFAVDNVPEGDKIKIVSIHLYDKALAWHLQFIKAHGETVGRDVYEEGIVKRFGLPLTLAYAFSLANFQEASLSVIKQRNIRLFPTPRFNTNSYANKNVAYPNKATIVTTSPPTTQVITKGTGVEECLEEEEEEESDMISYELSDPTPQTLPHISLNALSRIPTHN
ncbi:hypothetical protein Tco_0323320 [Tanacetum coccineum]